MATLGEGAVAISAVRAASNGQKLYVATKNAYALLDFTYSVADFGFKAADADMPDAWLYVGYAFAAKTSYDLINKGGAKGIGYLRKLLNEERSDEVLEIIEELDVSLKGKKLTTNDVEDFVQKAESKIKNADPEFNRQYEEGISGNFGDDWITYIGKGIDGVSSPPAGYQLYFRNGNKWIRRLDANNPSTPRLTVKEGKITEYTGNTISSFSSSQVNNIALAALNNASSNKVMLGKFDQGGISYITEAGTEYSYFYLDNWDDIYKLVNESGDEMWKVNAKFLENQFTANKTFYFSHNPYEATRSFKQEIDYLKNILEVKDFVKEGKYWKAIWWYEKSRINSAHKLKTKFDDIHLEETTYLNEESSSFSARFKIGDNSIIFVKDRGYIEVEILKEGEYTLIENLNKELNDLKFSLENIDRIIEFLGRIKYWINYCADEEWIVLEKEYEDTWLHIKVWFYVYD